MKIQMVIIFTIFYNQLVNRKRNFIEINSAKKIFILPAILVILNCSNFLIDERINLNNKKIKIHKNVGYEIISNSGSENRKIINLILEEINKQEYFDSISFYNNDRNKLKMQILIEDEGTVAVIIYNPKKPTTHAIEYQNEHLVSFIINRYISLLSGYIFPVIQVKEKQISFKLWNANVKIGEFKYKISTLTIFGIASILFTFVDDDELILQNYRDIVKKFIEDSEKIF